MAYKFDPVINTYVDPKSVEISKTLNERYAQNFAVNDALNTAMRDMQFAPFENDTALAKELRKSTDAKLQQIAARGDYENMTFPLHSIAKETGNMMKPLAENYQRYQTTVSELNKRLEKGDVNAEQYDLYKGYMTRGYKGIELDEYGRAKQGTAFSAPTLYNDPKIMDRVTKRLEILHTQETGRTTSRVQKDPTTGDLVSIDEGGTITQIDPKLVQKAVDAVMQESDVKMYLDQMGTMKTYKYSDAVGGPDKLIEMQATNLQDKLGQLNAELNSGKYRGNDKLQIQNSIDSIKNELNSLGQLSTPEQKLNYAKNSFIQEYEQPIREYASLKGGIYKQTSMYKVDNLSARERDKQAIAWDVANPTISNTGEINATQWGGKDINEKLTNINSKQAEIARLEKIISTGKSEDGTALDATEIAGYTDQVKGLKNDRKNIEAQIIAATNRSLTFNELRKQDPTLIDAMAEFYGTKDAGELYVKLQQTFDNTGDQDYLNFQSKFDAKYGQNSFANHQKEYYSGRAQLDKSFNQDSEQIAAENLGFTPSTTRIAQSDITYVFQNTFQNKVDKGLLEVKTAPVWTMNKVLGLGQDQTRGFTKVFNDLLLNKPLRSDMVYTNQNGEQIENLEGYTIAGYGMPQYGTKLMKLQVVKGDNKTPETIYMDMDQMTSPELKQVYNTNSFKLATRIADSGNAGKFDINLNTINTKTGQYASDMTLRFNDVNGNGKPLVTIIGADGKPVRDLTKYGIDAKLTGAIDPNSELFKTFISLPYFKVN